MNHLLISRVREGHEGMDDLADWAQTMPSNGLDYQGRFPQAAEACTELGADEDWESADAEVLLMLLKAFLAILAFLALLWMTKP